MKPCEDLTNRRFGRLIASGLLGRFKMETRWICKCDCGNITTTSAKNLKSGRTRSCGCLLIGRNHWHTHGQSNTLEWKIWVGAKHRAQECGWDFNIDISDIHIPAICPILGIPLITGRGKGTLSNNSPSIDRTNSFEGYIKGNIAIISHKANNIKSNGTAEEHLAVARYMRGCS